MPYRVVVTVPLTDVPADVDAMLQDRLHEIADSLDRFSPREVALWHSLEEGGLFLDIKGWRFIYRVDRHNGALIVGTVLFKGDE